MAKKQKNKKEELEENLEREPDMDLELSEEIVVESTEEEGEDIGIDLTSKHQEYKKHSLKHDDIFKGKKQPKKEDEEEEDEFYSDRIEIDPGLNLHEESQNNADYHRLKALKEEVKRILETETDLDFTRNRRKPGPSDFNKYYSLMKNRLDVAIYSRVEIFVELSYYFSDNLYNMFKMLNQKDGAEIIKELRAYMKVDKKLNDIDFL